MKLVRYHRRQRAERVLAVESGQVMCPRQGVVDIERCWMCPAYGGMSEAHDEGVVCTADLRDQVFDIRTAV